MKRFDFLFDDPEANAKFFSALANFDYVDDAYGDTATPVYTNAGGKVVFLLGEKFYQFTTQFDGVTNCENTLHEVKRVEVVEIRYGYEPI